MDTFTKSSNGVVQADGGGKWRIQRKTTTYLARGKCSWMRSMCCLLLVVVPIKQLIQNKSSSYYNYIPKKKKNTAKRNNEMFTSSGQLLAAHSNQGRPLVYQQSGARPSDTIRNQKAIFDAWTEPYWTNNQTTIKK